MERADNIKLRKWFIEKKSGLDKERLFVFHHAGGGATYYMPLLKELSDKFSVYFVQLPGREYRIEEQAYDNWELLLDDLTEALVPYLDKPFVFFGHSMGAIISYELTYRLKKRGFAPKHLYLSSLASPNSPRDNYSKLPDKELMEKLMDLGGTDKESSLNSKLMAMILPTLRKDLHLCDTYRCSIKEKIDVPVTMLGGDKDLVVNPDDLLEWKEFFSGPFELHIFEGNHFYFRNQFSDLALILAG